MRRVVGIWLVMALGALALPAAAGAQVQPYQAGDGRGFHDILPPGTNGFVNGPQLASFLSTGARPEHNDDQLAMYGDLVYAAPGLKAQDLEKFFKDSSFGVRPGDVARTYNPRPDVTVVRDKSFGVPHIYGSTRAGTMFGLGYITAEDRLFFIDVLRHVGRAQLSSFVGGSEANREMDRTQWALAPYTEADFQKQIDRFDDFYGAEGAALRQDALDYVAGINEYIRQARLDSSKMPGEYNAINRPQGPDDWQGSDVVAIAALVGGIFGKGGGGEVGSALVFQEFVKRYGPRVGAKRWADFRAAEDPEAPTTVHRKRFPYQVPPKRPRGTAMPDPGSIKQPEEVTPGGVSPPASGLPLIGMPGSASNALVVSGRESRSGHPLAVFGPQTGYFAPQILMEQDVHGPGIDARGVSFPGTNLFVQLGRGRDYSWSATSAGNDNTDTFALDLCEPDGSTPTIDSSHYRYRGECLPFEVLERTNSWTPNAADMTPAGSETIRVQRTRLGLARERATVKGKPVVYTSLRSTYFHEVDSGIGFSRYNNPNAIKGPRDFQKASFRIGYTFNWLYVDDKHVAYFNSGNTPVRAKNADTNFPVEGRLEWRNWNPDLLTADYAPFRQHPQVVNQSFITSWNGKQARGYRAADGRYNYSSVDRVQPLNDRIRRGIRGRRKMRLITLVNAMEDAGTVDLRGDKVLAWALRVIGERRDPALRDAIAKLQAWRRDGSHRRDKDRSGVYEHSEAIRIMDAWWPSWIEAQFRPALGKELYEKTILSQIGLGDMPNDHLGSAFDDGIWGHAQKDLRRVLGRRVRGRFSTTYCGRGSLRRCRLDLIDSLRQALTVKQEDLYKDSECTAGDQMCFDEVRFRALGAVTQPPIPWINRPTYQQVVEVQGRGR